MSATHVTIGGRRLGKTTAAAAAAGMSMDAYRALQRRIAWDTKAAVDRAVDEACRRDFPLIKWVPR